MIIPFFTDNHLRGNNSTNRIGNYYQDSIAKLKEILSIAKQNNSPFILCGGDLIDSPIISLTICDELIELVEKNGIPIYTLVGNHPLFGHDFELSFATTMLHIMRRSTFFRKLDILEIEDFVIKGFEYSHDVEESIKNDGLILGQETKKWKIAITHSFITPKPFLPQVLHVCVDDIKTDFDLVLMGHYHHPWSKIVEGVKFINPGCVGRLKIDEADIEPSIVLLDTDKRETKIVKLKSAKPKEEVFDLKKIAEIKHFESDINKFIAELATTKFSETDVLGMVKEIGKQKKIDKEVITEVENRIIALQGEEK